MKQTSVLTHIIQSLTNFRCVFQSGIVATCRSELGRLEQVRILVDPLGLGRDPSSPCYRPEGIDVAGRSREERPRHDRLSMCLWRVCGCVIACVFECGVCFRFEARSGLSNLSTTTLYHFFSPLSCFLRRVIYSPSFCLSVKHVLW